MAAGREAPMLGLNRSLSVTMDRPEGVDEKEERDTKCLLFGFVGVKASKDHSLSDTHSHILTGALSQVDSDIECGTPNVVEGADTTAERIGKELAEIADDMDEHAKQNLDGLFSDFLPVLGSPTLAYKLFLNTAKRTFEWNESGVVRVTASSLRHLLSLCYRLCQRFLEQFGHISGAGRRLQVVLETLSGFLIRLFSSWGLYQMIRERGWQSIIRPMRNIQLSTGGKIAVGALAVIGLSAAGYFLYRQLQP